MSTATIQNNTARKGNGRGGHRKPRQTQTTAADLAFAGIAYAAHGLTPVLVAGQATEWEIQWADQAEYLVDSWAEVLEVLFDSDGRFVRFPELKALAASGSYSGIDPVELKDRLEWVLDVVHMEPSADNGWVGFGIDRDQERRAARELRILDTVTVKHDRTVARLAALLDVAKRIEDKAQAHEIRDFANTEIARASRIVKLEGEKADGERARFLGMVNAKAQRMLTKAVGNAGESELVEKFLGTQLETLVRPSGNSRPRRRKAPAKV